MVVNFYCPSGSTAMDIRQVVEFNTVHAFIIINSNLIIAYMYEGTFWAGLLSHDM